MVVRFDIDPSDLTQLRPRDQHVQGLTISSCFCYNLITLNQFLQEGIGFSFFDRIASSNFARRCFMRRGGLSLGKRSFVGLILFMTLLFSSSLGFADWTPVVPPEVSPNWGLQGVHFTSATAGWAVGIDYANKSGVVLRFRNSAWEAMALPEVSSDWELHGFFFTAAGDTSTGGTSAGQGWAVGVDNSGKKGVLLHYINGAWMVVIPPNVSENWGLFGIHLTSSDEGWAVGVDYSNQRGVLLQRSKGIWTNVVPPSASLDWGLYGIHLISINEGWAVGVDRTNHRGALLQLVRDKKAKETIWTVVPPPKIDSDWELSQVRFVSSDNGWAAGIDHTNQSGILLRWSSSIWTPIALPEVSTDWELDGVQFTSTNEGWAVGIDYANKTGVLLQFEKGSVTVVTPPAVSSDWEIDAARFTSSKEGWAVGMDRANQRGVLLRFVTSASETVSAPNLPDGPTNGTTGIEYIYTAGGASSNLGHSIQYFFDWGDGTNSGWLPAGTLSSPKVWTNPGIYIVKVQARCAPDTSVVSKFSSGLSVSISSTPTSIDLVSPSDGTDFQGCSLYSLPTFSWNAGESFSSYEIQFSKTQNFDSIPVKVGTSSTTAVIQKAWNKVLLIPGTAGGPVYWRVVGERANKTTAISGIFSMIVDPAQAVENPNIINTSKSSLPTLSWQNECNVKFRVWFGNDGNFSKKASLSFNIKNPNDNQGVFTRQLLKDQWKTIRNVVGDVSGSTIYWYVESWDGVNRRSLMTPPASFLLEN